MAPRVYKAVLVKLMSYLDGVDYDHDHEFTQEQLAALTPADLLRWFNVQTFGMPEPPDEANPTLARSNSIKFWKKAISSFMTNRMMPWNEIGGIGNPTRSKELNELIKRVMKKEVRRQGAQPKARRAMKRDEYDSMQQLLREEGDTNVSKYGIPAMNNFQFHMIGRIDDTTQFKVENLQSHPNFDFCLKAKLNWSKNVNEERDAPWQVIIGAMNTVYCVLISLALWLEVYILSDPNAMMTPYVFAFSDDNKVPSGGDKSKQTIQGIFARTIFSKPVFANHGGPLGSHSVRKYASTESRKRGATKDEKDIRGRWKGKGRVSDVYDDVELPFPDAKVAGLLCIGGPCKYVVKEGSGVTNAFILEHVVPQIARRFPQDVSIVLGTALLWYVFSPEGAIAVPQNIRNRIVGAYHHIRVLDEGINPVAKIPLVITGHEGEVYMDPIVDCCEQGEGGNGEAAAGNGGGANGGATPAAGAAAGAFANRPTQQQLMALHSQMMQVGEGLNGLRVQLEEDRVARNRQYQTLNSNIQRVAIQPARRVHNNNGGGEGGNGEAAAGNGGRIDNATLSPTPRNLYLLWQEYQHGIGGRKAAKLFTPQERGRVKFKYSRRKVVWDCISTLVRSGMTANVAIDRIYQVYGANATVTQVVNRMRRDRIDNNLHPLLQA